MTVLRRLTLVAALTTGLIVVAASPGVASLEEYLEQAQQADYSGRKLVVTLWGGGSEVGVFDVVHVADMTTIGGGQGSSVSDGRVVGGAGGAVVLQDWSVQGLAGRYTTSEPVASTRLGRAAETVDVLDGDLVRARIVFDTQTRVPLVTEIFDGNGQLFRYSAMLEFDPNALLRYDDLRPDADDYDVMVPASSAHLPGEAAGYVRADTYAGPDDTIQAFYTDGLFTFSIFEIAGDVTLERFQDTAVFESGDASYLQLVAPSELWMSWSTGDTTHVLVGDLPPDHLTQVLAELPQPDDDGLLNRIWNGIFG